MTENITIYKELIGKSFSNVYVTEDYPEGQKMIFQSRDDKSYKFYHTLQCCESVEIKEIVGDLSDLVGSPIIEAEEKIIHKISKCDEFYSETSTFYKFATEKGFVTVTWLGQSNGEYSESVDFEEITDA